MTTPSAASPPLSAGTLFYLWGDQVLPPVSGVFKTKVRVPSGAEVDAGDLSALVFAVSMWNLREGRALDLQPSERRSLGVFRSEDVALTFGAQLGARGGYEDVVMRQVSEGKHTAYDVVRAWFGRDVSSPELSVFAIAREEIVACGLGQEVDAGRGAVAGFFKGRTELQVDPEAVRGTWEEFWSLHERWKSSWSADPIAYRLVEACRQGIASREETDRD